MILSVFNVFYNNLFVNLRFKCKTCCKCIGVCCFDVFNWLIGYCCMKKLCQDKCFSVFTIIKWLATAGIFGYTIYAVDKTKKDLAD